MRDVFVSLGTYLQLEKLNKFFFSGSEGFCLVRIDGLEETCTTYTSLQSKKENLSVDKSVYSCSRDICKITPNIRLLNDATRLDGGWAGEVDPTNGK
jgi:hypothetical protein